MGKRQRTARCKRTAVNVADGRLVELVCCKLEASGCGGALSPLACCSTFHSGRQPLNNKFEAGRCCPPVEVVCSLTSSSLTELQLTR